MKTATQIRQPSYGGGHRYVTVNTDEEEPVAGPWALWLECYAEGEPGAFMNNMQGNRSTRDYVRRSEDRLSEPRSPRLDHRRKHLVRGPRRAGLQDSRPG